MALYRVGESKLAQVPETTFATERLLERRDLQRLIRNDVSVIGGDLLVVAEEYGDWEDSSRRVDLLCLDRQARIVVVELKRTEDGGHMELQALRYAAMVSSMRMDQLVSAHARFLGGDDPHQNAEASIASFLGWENASEGALSDEVRIVLVAANFSVELTTAVLWLNKCGLDLTCIRIRPYRLDGEVLIDVQQLIPLPEAADYETKIRSQSQEKKRLETARDQILRRFWAQLIDRSKPRTSIVANRTASRDQWLTGSVGRSGFNLNFSLTQESSRVECMIDMGKGSEEKNLAAFHTLLAQRDAIETHFGEPLDWQELNDARSCRICHTLTGGWKTPETEWPALQDKLIDAMVRLEGAFRNPILAIKV